MSSLLEDTYNFCRVRSQPIFDNSGAFLGTASAISSTKLLTCNHCLNSGETVIIAQSTVPVSSRLLSSDLALLDAPSPLHAAYFVVSSEGPRLNEEVLVYGYRLRDGQLSDVVLTDKVGSIGDRKLAPSCKTQKVFGLQRQSLLDPGMSGGVVLRATNFELLGCIIGFDHNEDGGRKEDLAISLTSVSTESLEIAQYLTFSYQHRAALSNAVRRFFSLSGFVVGTERLGDVGGLEECFLCTRGLGVLKESLLVLVATAEQMRSANTLEELKTLAKARASSRRLAFDRAIVVVEDGCPDYSYLNFVVTIGELAAATPIFSVGQSDGDSKADVCFIGGDFLSRQVLISNGDEPTEAVEMIIEAIRRRVRCIAITGPVGAGKATLLANLNEIFQNRILSGDLATPTICLASLTANDARDNWILQQGALVIAVTDFDDLWVTGESRRALRGLKSLITHLETRQDPWSVVFGLSGGVEQANLVLSSRIFTEQSRKNDIVVSELLPIDSEVIRQALSAELGSVEGEAWWKTVTSSQEIFQIAQWPCGLAVLLDRVVQEPWANHRANQVEVIAALVNGFLSKGGCREGDFPPSATLSFLIEIAKEVNATQRMQVSLDRARILYTKVAPEAYQVQLLHNVAVHDILVPGLLSQSATPRSVSFDSPIFLHYLLAVAIKTSIDLVDLSPANPLYHRRLPVALLKDVVDLGVDPDRLSNLIDLTKTQPEDDVGFIGGNCISLLRLLGSNFRNRKLATCNLRGGIFAGCDLSGADFSNATLVDVGLANAILDDANFSGADLERADLKTGCTVYQLAPYERGMYVASSVRRLLWVDLTKLDSPRIEEIEGFHDAVFSVAVSDSEKLVVAGGQDGTLRGWDCISGEPRFVLRGHFSDVRSVVLQNKIIISGSVDGHINIWNRWSATLVSSYRLCGGQIWSIGMLSDNTVAALCDHGHIHITGVADGKEMATYDLPPGYTRKLLIDNASRRIMVGGEEQVWILDLSNHQHWLASVPHPGVRAILPRNRQGYLLGGAYGQILWTDPTFSTFRKVNQEDGDYISDFAPFGKKVLVGRADGILSVLKQDPSGWIMSGESIILDKTKGASASGADFRSARNIPAERRTRLAAAGAIT